MWKLRPPWPSFVPMLILVTIVLQTFVITHQQNTPRGPITNEEEINDTNRDVDKLNDHSSRLKTSLTSAETIRATEVRRKTASSYNNVKNNEETAITLLSNNTNTSIHDRNQHHRKINNNKDKRRKRKKVHKHHAINNNNSTSSINSHNNHIKPKSNSISIKSANSKNNDDLVELIDEIDELEFNNGTILQTNVRRKKDGYYVKQPNGVVVYRRYKCVPKSNSNQQSLTQSRHSTTYSSQYPSSYRNQRWRQLGM